MFQWLKNRNERHDTAGKIYGAVVAAARQPELYAICGVADTAEGRFELIALNLFMVLEQLNRQPVAGTDLTRLTIERFIIDMDDCMREEGVGDTTVPKKVRRAAAAFYERSGAYRAALNVSADTELTDAIDTYIFGGKYRAGATRLAAHVRGCHVRLTATGVAADHQLDENLKYR